MSEKVTPREAIASENDSMPVSGLRLKYYKMLQDVFGGGGRGGGGHPPGVLD